MFYPNIIKGTFLARPNRFLARVLLNGKEAVCHVKNTGRLGELLIPGAVVAVQFHPDARETGRKTSYSLIGVLKKAADEELWVNIDSQAPNQAVLEWLRKGNALPFPSPPEGLRREVRFDKSRFDLSFTVEGRPWFLEVKGVTLEQDGVAMFPDAPTDRGVKHLKELILAKQEGCGACVMFVIQMKGISSFCPNRKTHPEFALALARAAESEVLVLAYDCVVTENSLSVSMPISVDTGTTPI